MAAEERLPRAVLERRLERILARIDGEKVFRAEWTETLLGRRRCSATFEIDAVYVVGSFARGAPTCGDLDLLLTVRKGVYAAGDAGQALYSVTFAMADGARAGASTHQSLVFGARTAGVQRGAPAASHGAPPRFPRRSWADLPRRSPTRRVIFSSNPERSRWPFFVTRRIVVRP
jgi:hypothetical protein